MTGKYYEVVLEEDSDENLILPFPTELLNQMGWDIGDDLVWSDNFDGTFSLKKAEVDNDN